MAWVYRYHYNLQSLPGHKFEASNRAAKNATSFPLATATLERHAAQLLLKQINLAFLSQHGCLCSLPSHETCSVSTSIDQALSAFQSLLSSCRGVIGFSFLEPSLPILLSFA
jgi:hypothetical protein